MTTLSNNNGSKSVIITYNEYNGYTASYQQNEKDGGHTFLACKSFTTNKKATNWGTKKLELC